MKSIHRHWRGPQSPCWEALAQPEVRPSPSAPLQASCAGCSGPLPSPLTSGQKPPPAQASPHWAALPPSPPASGVSSDKTNRRCPAALFPSAGHPVRKGSPLRWSLRHPESPWKGPRKGPLGISEAGKIIYNLSALKGLNQAGWPLPTFLLVLDGLTDPGTCPHTHNTFPSPALAPLLSSGQTPEDPFGESPARLLQPFQSGMSVNKTSIFSSQPCLPLPHPLEIPSPRPWRYTGRRERRGTVGGEQEASCVPGGPPESGPGRTALHQTGGLSPGRSSQGSNQKRSDLGKKQHQHPPAGGRRGKSQFSWLVGSPGGDWGPGQEWGLVRSPGGLSSHSALGPL